MKISEFIYSSSLKNLERDDRIAFKSFNNNVAWNIIDKIRSFDLNGNSIVVSIKLFNGLTLNECVIGDNVNPSNFEWASAKFNTVSKYHMSSHRYGQQLIAKYYKFGDNQIPNETIKRITSKKSSNDEISSSIWRELFIEDEEYHTDYYEIVKLAGNIQDEHENKCPFSVNTSVEQLQSTFKNIKFEDDEDNVLILNLRLKSSNEKVVMSPTNLMSEKTHLKFPVYSGHGGAIPINIKGLPSPIGAISISGMPNGLDDHKIAYKALIDVIENQ